MNHRISDLEYLAKYWSVIFGKALDPSGVTGVQGLVLTRSGRLDSVDEKSPEIQRALRALDRLHELHQQKATRQAAEVLLYSRVMCGEQARVGKAMFLSLGLAYRSAPKKMTPAKQRVLVEIGWGLYDAACAVYRKITR